MKILVLGGGFAGRAALKKLAGLAKSGAHEITLIDRNTYTTMLLSLPDVSGGRVPEKDVSEDLLHLAPENVRVIQDTAAEVNFDAKTVLCEKGNYSYDRLILAAGSVTNFYGFKEHPELTYKMDCLEDALRLRQDYMRRLSDGALKNVIIVGAGFTGLEMACSLCWAAKKSGKPVRFVLVEKTAKVLPMLPAKTCEYVKGKMTKLGFEILTENEVTAFDGKNVTLKTGESFDDALLIWTAGMKAAVRLNGKHAIIADGRVTVDEFLRVPAYPEVFVAGDFAAFKHGESYLRRAAYYAATMGKKAAENVVREAKKLPLKKFKPFDPGWVIPLYNTSVGNTFGIPVKGRIGVPMHYFVIAIRNFSFRKMIAYFIHAVRFLFDRA